MCWGVGKVRGGVGECGKVCIGMWKSVGEGVEKWVRMWGR